MGKAQSMGRLGQVRIGGDVAMTPMTRHNVMRQQQEDHRLGFTHGAGSSRETRQQGRNLISVLDAISKKMVNLGVRLAVLCRPYIIFSVYSGRESYVARRSELCGT